MIASTTQPSFPKCRGATSGSITRRTMEVSALAQWSTRSLVRDIFCAKAKKLQRQACGSGTRNGGKGAHALKRRHKTKFSRLKERLCFGTLIARGASLAVSAAPSSKILRVAGVLQCKDVCLRDGYAVKSCCSDASTPTQSPLFLFCCGGF